MRTRQEEVTAQVRDAFEENYKFREFNLKDKNYTMETHYVKQLIDLRILDKKDTGKFEFKNLDISYLLNKNLEIIFEWEFE